MAREVLVHDVVHPQKCLTSARLKRRLQVTCEPYLHHVTDRLGILIVVSIEEPSQLEHLPCCLINAIACVSIEQACRDMGPLAYVRRTAPMCDGA